MLSKELLEELEQILKEEFNLELTDIELHKFATSLVGYFNVLLKATNRSENG